MDGWVYGAAPQFDRDRAGVKLEPDMTAMATRSPRFVLFAATAALMTSCAAYVEQRVESAILEALPQALGSADRYEAQVQGANGDATHFDQVRAIGVWVRRARTPVLDRVETQLQDVTVDRQAKRVTAIGDAKATVRLKDADLAAYLRQQPWIENPAVRFNDASQIVVTGRLKLPGIALITNQDAEFRGRLVPRESRLLMLVESVRYGNREAPAVARGLIEQAINPVIDTAAYAVPSRIDAVSVEGDTLVVDASGSRMQARNVGKNLSGS